MNASAVIGHQGWLAGYQMAFDTGKSKLTKNNFSLGYSLGDFVLHTNVNDGKVFGGSVFQKVNSKLETGVNLGWTASKNETTFGVGCKYELDKNATVRAKVNNSSQIGLGYQQKLRDGKSSIIFCSPDLSMTCSIFLRCHRHPLIPHRRKEFQRRRSQARYRIGVGGLKKVSLKTWLVSCIIYKEFE